MTLFQHFFPSQLVLIKTKVLGLVEIWTFSGEGILVDNWTAPLTSVIHNTNNCHSHNNIMNQSQLACNDKNQPDDTDTNVDDTTRSRIGIHPES